MNTLKFIIIPLYEDEDQDLIEMKATLLRVFNNPDEPGEASYKTGRYFADLIRTGMNQPDGE